MVEAFKKIETFLKAFANFSSLQTFAKIGLLFKCFNLQREPPSPSRVESAFINHKITKSYAPSINSTRLYGLQYSFANKIFKKTTTKARHKSLPKLIIQVNI